MPEIGRTVKLTCKAGNFIDWLRVFEEVAEFVSEEDRAVLLAATPQDLCSFVRSESGETVWLNPSDKLREIITRAEARKWNAYREAMPRYRRG